MTEPQDKEQLSHSPEVLHLIEDTENYQAEYARALTETFPEFTDEQSKKAISLAYRFALERAREKRDLEEVSGKDALTGLDNRTRFAKDARIEIANAIRNKQGFAIFFVDVDHFKEVNDQSSHATGDEVLRQITQQLSKGARKGDRLARLGGEEILGLVKVPTDNSVAAAERWRKNLENANITYVTGDGKTKKVTVSIGVAIFNPNININPQEITDAYINRELNSIVRLADMAMYTAKGSGRNRVGFSNPDGSFATLDPNGNGGNKLTTKPKPNVPPQDDYFKL